MFRGALDVRAREINTAMKAAAVRALADFVGDKLERGHIIPGAFEPGVADAVAKAVARRRARERGGEGYEGASCGRDNGLPSRGLCVEANTRLPSDAEAGAARGLRSVSPGPSREGHTRRPRAQPRYGARNRACPYARTPGWSRFSPKSARTCTYPATLSPPVQEGVRRGYAEGYLRKSVVADPLRRVNTGDNTPANIALRLVPGESVKLTVSPKGRGQREYVPRENAHPRRGRGRACANSCSIRSAPQAATPARP